MILIIYHQVFKKVEWLPFELGTLTSSSEALTYALWSQSLKFFVRALRKALYCLICHLRRFASDFGYKHRHLLINQFINQFIIIFLSSFNHPFVNYY